MSTLTRSWEQVAVSAAKTLLQAMQTGPPSDKAIAKARQLLNDGVTVAAFQLRNGEED